MAALARQRHPAGLARNQPADAQTCSGTDNGLRRVFHQLFSADLHQVFALRLRNRQRLRGKIVQQDKGFQTERLACGFDGKRPVVVGHLHPVAQNRIGNGNCGMADFRIADALQKFAGRIDDGVVVVAGQNFCLLDLLRRNFQREAGVGAAYVGHHARPTCGRLVRYGFIFRYGFILRSRHGSLLHSGSKSG